LIRARFLLSPHGSAEALAIEESIGMPSGPSFVRGRVVSEADGVAVLDFPESNWGRNVPMLLSALVAGEGVETRAFTRCRLVGLELPAGFLPGPAFPPLAGVGVGVIFKPSLGLSPSLLASLAVEHASAGAVLLKDDELLGDPEWCPLYERVAAVAAVLSSGPSSGCIYTPNITGPSAGLVERARRVVALGAGGVMVNAFTQGLDSVLALREADLGVPVFAHRVGSGPWARSADFGVSGAVLAELTRLCGADFVQVGAYGGKLFDSDDEVDAQLAAARGGDRPATAVIGGGVGPSNVASLAARAGGSGLLMLLGSAAYLEPDGVRRSVSALAALAGSA
jgi:ribulose 1,5-bisphosphate carboxylase large subunit-like protein